MLSCYRILDLTDERGLICGRALSDFGAEVIKVEKPGGDITRRKGPFFHDSGKPEDNLTWLAFNINKKNITLDIETPEGQVILKQLIKKSDVVIESYSPGYLDKLGLGYADLSQINPGIIMTSITGFGQEGPYREFKAPDIVVRALGGLIYSVGYEDRPPLTSASYEHAYLIGAMYAAVGTMIALSQRVVTGLGQHVDAPVQQACAVVCSAEIEGPYALFGRILSRHGRARGSVTLKDGTIFYNPLLWECKDGDIAFNLLINPTSVKANLALMEGIKRDGIDLKFLNDWQWDKQTWRDMTLEQANETVNIISQFFRKHTKGELLEMAIKNRFQLGPCNTAADVLDHPQLAARQYWQEIDYPALGTSFKYPGGAVKMTGGYCGPRTRARRIGEDNAAIYGELGIPDKYLAELEGKGII